MLYDETKESRYVPVILSAIVIFLNVATIVLAAPLNHNAPVSPVNPVACTAEAKLCPDGTAVRRTGPNCEFVACPSTRAVPMEDQDSGSQNGESGIKGTVMLGPRCPVMRLGMEEQCKDQPYQTTLVIVTSGRKPLDKFDTRMNGIPRQEIAKINSQADGTFQVVVPPGKYIITSVTGKTVPYPFCKDIGPVLVEPGRFTDVVVGCDTGIR